MRSSLLAAAIFAVALPFPVMAGSDDNSLKIAFTREMDTLNPFLNTTREGVILSRHVWDGLLHRDQATGEYVGNLATSWAWIDDTTLEFTLREGVTFHNGEPFNADDVVYTMNFVADPENGVNPQRNVSWIKEAVKIDDFTVRILTDGPFPAALEFLSGPVVVLPDTYFAEVGPEGMATAPIGSGPYEVTESVPGESLTLTRFADYHAGSPKGTASIDTIIWRTIPEANTRIAEMLSGGLDWIWQVPADQADRLAATGRYNVVNESTMRIGYLYFDASDRHGETPFDDLRVRQAVSHAVNRQAIVDNLLKGASEVVHSACFPSQFGCDTTVTRYEYDPEKAKALLAEAGYPDGFEIPFVAYRNRDYAEAMMADLANVGIRTSLDYKKYAATRDQIQAGEVPFAFMTWGSYSINDISAITSIFFKGGIDDYARDPEVIGALDTGDTVTDPEVRRAAYSQALNRIADQAYWLPLFSYNSNYVFDLDLNFTPTPDEIPTFYNASWQ
ncbi:MAG: ABC transporter substrate-binding protein [Rhodobacteraceae bacterium]|nr:ABC transporter substrate-binding protein [Paracoccaceae bacterium]MCY4195424.1 ABC transporter substrate-binding protein [Paracoccaceae bacterium]